MENQQNILTLDDIYFKDAFTKTTNGIDVEANQLSINCLTSNENKFHLDSDGNLTVKSITAEEGVSVNSVTVGNLMYPIGSIYLSINHVNPTVFFGGIWEVFATGKTLIGVDATQTEFDAVEKTGGNKTTNHHHTLSKKAGAAIMHHWSAANDNFLAWKDDGPVFEGNYLRKNETSYSAETTKNISSVPLLGNTDTSTISNLPPYITCYMWKRIG